MREIEWLCDWWDTEVVSWSLTCSKREGIVQNALTHLYSVIHEGTSEWWPRPSLTLSLFHVVILPLEPSSPLHNIYFERVQDSLESEFEHFITLIHGKSEQTVCVFKTNGWKWYIVDFIPRSFFIHFFTLSWGNACRWCRCSSWSAIYLIIFSKYSHCNRSKKFR